ncbi:hypothetical protein ACF0H5_006877 [Mactra antiquata]
MIDDKWWMFAKKQKPNRVIPPIRAALNRHIKLAPYQEKFNIIEHVWNDALCGDRGNKFYDIEDVSRNLMVAGSIMIGGQQKRVTKIMTFKMSWLKTNWQDPLTTLISQQQREREAIQRRQQTSGACIIL